MDITSDDSSQFSTRLHQLAMLAWYNLASPKLTGALIAAILLATVVGLLLPQQLPSAAGDGPLWIASLPAVLQLWGELLYFLGFARIFQSLWFWLPVGLLFLNSLIALAAYGPGSWERLSRSAPPITWQHPLAGRVEQVVRLSRLPDRFLTTLPIPLREQGFFVYEPVDPEARTVAAGQRRWAWLGIVAVYGGLTLLVTAVLMSHYFLQTDRTTLFPGETQAIDLFEGKFEFLRSGSDEGRPWIIYWPDSPDSAPRAYLGRLYQPIWLNNTLLLPVASDPILVVEASDAPNSRLQLVPIQEDLSPAERLNFPQPDAETPLYVLIPAVDLAVQILPGPDPTQNEYNVQVRHGDEETPSDNLMVQAGETIWIDDVRLMVFSDRSLRLWAYFDPALPLYVAGGGLAIIGLLATFVPFLRPMQLWLVPEAKGLGGQLYGVIETFGSMGRASIFLEQLLPAEEIAEATEEKNPLTLESE